MKKLSLLLPISVLLVGLCWPYAAGARGVASAKQKSKAGAAAAGPRGARPKAVHAGPRNPITGSRVSKGAPKAKSVPKAPPRAARPAPKAKAGGPPSGAKRPAPKGAAKSPAPKGPVATRPAPKAPVATRPAPKAKGPVATRPAPKAKGPGATRPAPKPKRPVVVRPKPKPKPPVAARPTPKPGQVSGGRAPGGVTYPGQLTKPAPRPKRPPHQVPRPRPKPVNQIVNNTSIRQSWNQWNSNNTTIWNNNQVINNRPVIINQNFRRSVNYAYRPASWGARPWWSASNYHRWHYGSWNYGWNRPWQYYRRPRPYYPPGPYLPGYYVRPIYYRDTSSISWGLAAWTLGRLAFDLGYNSYRNPYAAPPVRTSTTVIHYTQPLSVVAAQETPEPEEVSRTAAEKSTAAIERARGEFHAGDYLAAMQSTDEAISFAPGDSTLHEFRALCLFALGRYGDAAGVLNPLLASGPGWDWSTMAGFYPDGDTYADQLRRLETYVEGSAEAADARFLLGYHYMVAGHIDEAYAMFDEAATLQPADRVAAQLRDLAASSSPNAQLEDGTEVPDPDAGPPAAEAPEIAEEPVDPAELEGAWQARSADEKLVTLKLGTDGKFTWSYEGAPAGEVLSGDWSIDEDGRLVLASADVQLVADVTLAENRLGFVLADGPVGDPGLDFERQ